MSEIEKKSLKLAFYFVMAFFLFSEVWDFFIYYLFPNRLRETTFLAAAITSPNSTNEILLSILVEGLIIAVSTALFSWLLWKLGFQEEFFDRQKLWVWVLVGVVASLVEFSEILGEIWGSVLGLSFLIVFGYRYKAYREQQMKIKKSQVV